MRQAGSVLLLILACMTTACRTRREVEATVRRVSRAALDRVPRLRLSHDRTICDGDSVPACAALSGDVVRTSDGGFLVHGVDGAVIRLDSLGRPVRTYGRIGDGPGEYRSVLALGEDRDGTVWVADIRRRALVAFAVDGKVVTRRLDPPRFMSFMRGWQGLYAYHVVPAGKRIGDSVTSRIELRTLTGRSVGAVPVPARAVQSDFSDLVPLPGWFEAKPEWDLGADSIIVYSDGRDPAVDVIRIGGARERLVLDVPARKVNGDEIRAAETRARQRPHREALIRQKSFNSARSHPAITAVRVLGGTRAVVRTDFGSTVDSSRWNVIRTDSLAILGFLMTGADDVVATGTDSTLVLLHEGADGGTRLVRFALHAPEGR